MKTKIRIMLAHNNELLRKSLIALLRTHPRLEVTAESKNGRELLEQLKQKEADIILIDAGMPVLDGLATLDIVQVRFPLLRVIVLSHMASHYEATNFMSRGAACYLTMDGSVTSMFKAIETVYSDGHYFDSSISKAMLGALIKGKKTGDALSDVAFNSRELEIMKAVCDGKTNKEIASALHLSASTIDFYKGKIYEKAGCNNVAGLIKYALKKGIIAVL